MVQFSPNNMGMMICQIGKKQGEGLPRITNSSQQKAVQQSQNLPMKSMNTINMSANSNLNSQYNQLVLQKKSQQAMAAATQ
mmetsp:Transcript_26311/g.40156  ORF Transcript_26311/g.40156 Transcript_26311/m.40156 type:complete len:81 (+) Transcript_26311:196-438(+)